MVQVEEVKNKRQLREFVMLPFTVYKRDCCWVPPLIREEYATFSPTKNPFFKHARVKLLLAYKDGVPVGRISSHIDFNFNEFWGTRTAQWGFFESINDPDVSSALFEAAVDFGRRNGMETLLGPLSFSTNNITGMLIDAFDLSPVVMMPYNPSYYPELVELFGFTKAKDLVAYTIEKPEVPERLTRASEILKKRGKFTIRKFDFSHLDDEVKILRSIYNRAWERNWGFVPMTDDEFSHTARQLKQIADKDLVFIAEVKGEPVGFSLAIPDINFALKKINGRLTPIALFKLLWYSRKITKLRVITFGVVSGFRNRGIEAALIHKTFEEGIRKGYRSAELSWVLEDNHPMRNEIEKLGGRVYKTYRLYSLSLV
ncbi:GNAT family N-acetyltransferase [bacterium]|nr:GNAT family N-acetyltransferase [bacterium]